MSTIIIQVLDRINKTFRNLCEPGFLCKYLKLSFTKQDHLANKLIGIDSKKRKLMILKNVNDKPVCCVIDLKDLRSCCVKKTYGSINAGSLKIKKLEEFLGSISLQLGFKERNKTVIINFYDQRFNEPNECLAMETKAKQWAHIVADLIEPPLGKTG